MKMSLIFSDLHHVQTHALRVVLCAHNDTRHAGTAHERSRSERGRWHRATADVVADVGTMFVHQDARYPGDPHRIAHDGHAREPRTRAW